MNSVVRSVVWRGSRNELWLVMKRGSKERTKMMKGRGAVVKGKKRGIVGEASPYSAKPETSRTAMQGVAQVSVAGQTSVELPTAFVLTY